MISACDDPADQCGWIAAVDVFWNFMSRILAAMSGGVDSSLATALLIREGHEVVGAYMKNWINEENVIGHCPWQEDIEDARAVADQLGVEFHVVNLMRDYREKVVKYLLEGYQQGITPNPDVMCNREMKFGVLWEWAKERGFDGIATGHYARIEKVKGESSVFRGVDGNKDQSYFLAMLRPEQVGIAHFPIGHLPKPVVREQAAQLGLKTAGKKDSQGICFIGEVRMEDFLRTFVDDNPGNIVDLTGKVLGEHRGLHLYTLGQRKGLRVASNLYKQAYVAVAKRPERNELVVAIERPDTPLLWSTRCVVGSLSSAAPLSFDPSQPRRLAAQPRYRCAAAAATYTPLDDGRRAELVFDEPQRALTPGQICVLYDGEQLLGGSVFEEIIYT
jgi:tRNA-specific 2-thiouridylase